MKDLNVTKNINIIEGLKSGALYKIADIFNYQEQPGKQKTDDISDLIILLYLLADKMGCQFAQIDKSIVSRLKNSIKAGENDWNEELKLLLRHFE